METFLTIASLRAVRSYSDRAIPSDTIDRIIDAGRVTGSAYNEQPWRFIVIQDRDTLQELAACVNRPSNLGGAPLGIVIHLTKDTSLTRFDAGRCVQNMVLAGWNEGVGSAPNFVREPDRCHEILGLDDGVVVTVLSFGFPDPPVEPDKHPAAAWVERTDRKPKDATVRFI